jgi:hypothetical protein
MEGKKRSGKSEECGGGVLGFLFEWTWSQKGGAIIEVFQLPTLGKQGLDFVLINETTIGFFRIGRRGSSNGPPPPSIFIPFLPL